MRIGVVGLGWIAASHLAAWAEIGANGLLDSEPVEVVGYDPNPHALQADRVPQLPSLEALVDAVDLVDVCTPTYTHAALVARVAERGRSMIVEKPLARTAADAVEAVRSCRRAGVGLAVGQVVRYFGEYETAHRAFATGDYGQPAVLTFRRATAQPRSNEWMHRAELSGGVAMDLGIHDLDQALWFAGDVQTVYAQAGLPKYGGALTHCYVTLRHAGGALSRLTASWALAGGFETSFEIAGTAGMLAYDNTDHPSLRTDRPDLVEGPALLPAAADRPFVSELRELATGLTSDGWTRVGPGDAVAAVAVVEAVLRSIESGQPERPEPLPEDISLTTTVWPDLAGATW